MLEDCLQIVSETQGIKAQKARETPPQQREHKHTRHRFQSLHTMPRSKQKSENEPPIKREESPPLPPPMQPVPAESAPTKNTLTTVIAILLMIGGALAVGTALMEPQMQKQLYKVYKSIFARNILFTREELSKYNGNHEGFATYLSILGKVYDVSEGEFYNNKGEYNFFSGTDATSAFVTGTFSGDAIDSVDELETRQLLGIQDWAEFYRDHETYGYVGKLIGTYYDEKGQPTEALKVYEERLKVAQNQQEEAKEIRKRYPICNSRWSKAEGGKVWCTRDLIKNREVTEDLVPRKFLEPGAANQRCACVVITEIHDQEFELYDNCDPYETFCITGPPVDDDGNPISASGQEANEATTEVEEKDSHNVDATKADSLPAEQSKNEEKVETQDNGNENLVNTEMKTEPEDKKEANKMKDEL